MFPSTESFECSGKKLAYLLCLYIVTCGAVTSEEKHQVKHPEAKPKKRPSELPQSPEDKKLSVQQASTTVGTMSCNRDAVLEGNLRSQSSEQMPLIPNNSEFPSQLSLPLHSNQEPILHDRYILKLLASHFTGIMLHYEESHKV